MSSSFSIQNFRLHSSTFIDRGVDLHIRVCGKSRSDSELPGNQTFGVSAGSLLWVIERVQQGAGSLSANRCASIYLGHREKFAATYQLDVLAATTHVCLLKSMECRWLGWLGLNWRPLCLQQCFRVLCLILLQARWPRFELEC